MQFWGIVMTVGTGMGFERVEGRGMAAFWKGWQKDTEMVDGIFRNKKKALAPTENRYGNLLLRKNEKLKFHCSLFSFSLF